MERLTRKELGKTTGAVMCTYTAEQCNDSCMYGMCKWNKKALLKLKEYEDVGLEPSEITELQEKYDALEDGAKNAYGLYKEYQRLEQDGLLVRLPCKAGSTVYAYSDFGRAIVPYTVEGIHISGNTLQINCCWYSHDDCMEGTEFEVADFGKTVFFTMDEAKEALKGDKDV